jgi:hypothetical protein
VGNAVIGPWELHGKLGKVVLPPCCPGVVAGPAIEDGNSSLWETIFAENVSDRDACPHTYVF